MKRDRRKGRVCRLVSNVRVHVPALPRLSRRDQPSLGTFAISEPRHTVVLHAGTGNYAPLVLSFRHRWKAAILGETKSPSLRVVLLRQQLLELVRSQIGRA